VFGKTLYGVNDAKVIQRWVQDNADALIASQNGNEFLELVWPLMMRHIHHKAFNKFNKKEVLKEITKKWLSGSSFHELFQIASTNDCRLGETGEGKRPRKVKIDHIVDICESGLAYDGSLLVSALCEFIEMLGHEKTGDTNNRLQIFEKRLKYGLPTEPTIALYELGFADRVISQDLTNRLSITTNSRHEIKRILKMEEAKQVLVNYPSYFQKLQENL
jgi:hypothetical protein